MEIQWHSRKLLHEIFTDLSLEYSEIIFPLLKKKLEYQKTSTVE